ncbi:EspA/EspE family type VII secretion system effector [Mycobacterium seoulense]|uniref:EspA/EspE family type VII secretion system effector n=1 Tax=Mycobacterium seoulense TaxID=386911 RepID=UPI003CF87563
MSVLTEAAKIIANLGGLAQNFGGPNGPQVDFGNSEYLASSVTSMGADATALALNARRLYKLRQAHVLARGVSATRRNAMIKKGQSRVRGASIILATLSIVEVMELTAGFGPPTDGSDLVEGSEQFSTLSEQLAAALPTESWQGTGSEAYADLDAALQSIALTMAELDIQLAAVVGNQADWVNHMKLGFGILKDLLIAAFFIEMAIRSLVPPPANIPTAVAFGIAVCAAGITVATGFLSTLVAMSVQNANKANALAAQYSQLAAGTVQHGSPAQSKVATAGQSTVSSFEAISNSMSGVSALAQTSSGTEPVEADGGSENERAPLSAQMSASETSEDGSLEAPKTSDTTASSPSGATMPTLAQVAAMAGQSSKLSGQVSQHMNLFNQAMGQIQQLSQMAKQGPEAAIPGEEAEAAGGEAVLTGDAAGAEAGLSAAGAERAPLAAAAAGTESAQQAGPAARVL